MKTKFAIILSSALVLIYAWAADLTVTVPDQDIPRVQEAFGSMYNLGRPATVQEVSRSCQDYIHQSTLDYERRRNTYTYTPVPMHFPTPTPTAGAREAEAKAAATPTPKKK